MAHEKTPPPLKNTTPPPADLPAMTEELVELLGVDERDILRISAKTGEGVTDVLDTVVDRIPAPETTQEETRALIFDSYYDPYRGVVSLARLVDGELKKGDEVRAMGSEERFELLEVGCYSPKPTARPRLRAGEVGYVIAGLKDIEALRVGDTVTHVADPADKSLPGYAQALPTVFSGLYPTIGDDFERLRDALQKLQLNDASLFFEPENSRMGFGFRCGFLGLLHMEIVQERLEREFDLDLIASAPSVEYHVQLQHGRGTVVVDNPSLLPNPSDIESIEEPWVKLSVVSPSTYIGSIMELSTHRRGTFENMEYLDPTRVVLHFEIPLAELIVDYFDQLKSRTQGYASMDYEELGYRPADLAKVDILVNGEPVDALSLIVHRDRAQSTGRALAERLKGLIPRQMFEIPIQAAIGSNVIARESVRAMRKNVLAKCYGGDI